MKHKPKISFGGKNTPLLRSLSEAEMPKEGLGAVFRGWKPLLYALLLSLASCKSCKKEVNPDPLPPETQTGANTFGCLIDGQPWIPNGGGGFSGLKPIYGAYLATENPPRNDRKDKHNVFISAIANINNIRSDMNIYVKNVSKTGMYNLSFDTPLYSQVAYPDSYGHYVVKKPSPQGNDVYVTTSQVTGWVNFTVADTITKRVAGTFEFDAIDKNTGKIIKITKGRFDIDPATLK